MTQADTLSRRDFLKRSGTAITALTVLAGHTQPPQGKSLAEIFGDMTLTDQYGQPFKPAELYKNQECLVVFGYNECAVCRGEDGKASIMDSVALIQQEMIRNGKPVPIIVVSIAPQDDKASMKSYLASYYERGAKQLASEILPADAVARKAAGEASFEQHRQAPQAQRIMHIVCPPSVRDAEKLQDAMGLPRNPNERRQHSAFMARFEHGVQQFRKNAPGYRLLPQAPNATKEAGLKHAHAIAQAVIADLGTPAQGR